MQLQCLKMDIYIIIQNIIILFLLIYMKNTLIKYSWYFIWNYKGNISYQLHVYICYKFALIQICMFIFVRMLRWTFENKHLKNIWKLNNSLSSILKNTHNLVPWHILKLKLNNKFSLFTAFPWMHVFRRFWLSNLNFSKQINK